MAIYHLSLKPLGRSGGRSSAAAAAYRAGACLVDRATGVVHDYTRRAGVLHAETVTLTGPVDRQTLWDAADAAERRKDARTAREIEAALPHELDREAQVALVRAYAAEVMRRYGVGIDWAMHAPDRRGDERNVHVHILMTTRAVSRGPDGSLVMGAKTAMELSGQALKAAGLASAPEQVRALRGLWAAHCNAALARAQRPERVDHRSHLARGIREVPGVHLGVHATAIERRTGEASRRRVDAERARAERHTEMWARRDRAARAARRAARCERVAEGRSRQAQHWEQAQAQAAEQARRQARYEQQREALEALGPRARAAGWVVPMGQSARGAYDERWCEWRTRQLVARGYDEDRARALASTLTVHTDTGGIVAARKGARVLDLGPVLCAASTDYDAVARLTVDMARAKGWPAIEATGPLEYQVAIARAAERAGLRCQISPEARAEMQPPRPAPEPPRPAGPQIATDPGAAAAAAARAAAEIEARRRAEALAREQAEAADREARAQALRQQARRARERRDMDMER